MIAVVADDLTGAAELGGIALRFQLSVEICTGVPLESSKDVLIIATDTRSQTEAEAVSEMIKVSKALALLNPDLIFKKVDSVLRGHVYAEMQAQLNELGLNRALLVPANPVLGRTLINGTYLIHGEPISSTGFSEDPEYPVRSSRVSDMLRVRESQVQFASPDEPLSSRGIAVGEVSSLEDLDTWAEKSNQDLLIAGGAGLFMSILRRRTSRDVQENENKDRPLLSGKILFVSGTAFRNSVMEIKRLYIEGKPVRYIPLPLDQPVLDERDELDAWAQETANLLKEKSTVALAIDSHVGIRQDARQLRDLTALAVDRVISKTKIDELIIEGGATASAILRKLGIENLLPLTEYAPGVIRSVCVSHSNLHITLKPGSYQWPPDIWMF